MKEKGEKNEKRIGTRMRMIIKIQIIMSIIFE